MTPSQIIVLATPVFFLLIALEFTWGYFKGRNSYRLSDAITSISIGMLSQLSAVFMPLLRVGIYIAVYSSVALYPNAEFWSTWTGWLIALVFYDFCYYWLHRAGHETAIFWAAHVAHHQSQDYNLSTALRQTSSGALLGWIFYLPLAVAGVPPTLFAVVALIDLLYQFWVHTEHVPKLGWFDRWFCSPSNHRVHHAVNDVYLDKNYGGILIVWDRLFGSFRDEGEKCVYGTRSPLNSWDPLWANAEVYWGLLKDSWHAQSWADKLRVWFKPPGWRPADVAQRYPKPAFDVAQLQRFHPPLSRAARWFAAAQFAALLQGAALFLWLADTLPLASSAVWLAALVAGLVSFLIAHLFYIALLRQGVAWFPSRRALFVTLGLGAAMYAFLWSGLNPVLKVAVAAYVAIIALMAAQAIGRATVLRDGASTGVALGVCFFMLSDSLLAINRFAQPLPLAPFWVLSTYYIAQTLIAHNARPTRA